jgi:hypothetical protein
MARLTRRADDAADAELWRAWMRRQPLADRFRGWISLLRRHGWHDSSSRWPRWARLAWRASPRYWIYAVATELFFCGLAEWSSSANVVNSARLVALHGYLPVADDLAPDAGIAPQQLVSELLTNYRRFVTSTRA